MQQNARRDTWSFEYTEQRLSEIMKIIHRLLETADEYGIPVTTWPARTSLGFRKVADAMIAFGVI